MAEPGQKCEKNCAIFKQNYSKVFQKYLLLLKLLILVVKAKGEN